MPTVSDDSRVMNVSSSPSPTDPPTPLLIYNDTNSSNGENNSSEGGFNDTYAETQLPPFNFNASNSSHAIKPWEDIVSAIEADSADSNATYTIYAADSNATFTIYAADSNATFTASASEVMDFGQDTILSPEDEASIEGDIFSFEVTVATSAVTADTLISDEDGNLVRMGDLSYSFLVPSLSELDAGTVALISIDHNTGEVDGIVQKKDFKKGMHISQEKGGSIIAVEEPEFIPTPWRCGVTEEHQNDPVVRHRLLKSYEGQDDHHDHDVHIHSHDHGFDSQDLGGSIENLRKSLRGVNVSFGNRRRLKGKGYDYVLNVYVQYDQDLVDTTAGIGGAFKYINLLFVLLNTIAEPE